MDDGPTISVLALMVTGASNRSIAESLVVSANAIETHVSALTTTRGDGILGSSRPGRVKESVGRSSTWAAINACHESAIGRPTVT